MLETAGHQVVGVMIGIGRGRQVPDYFASAMPTSVTVLPTLEFVFRNNRAVNLPATLGGIRARLPAYVRALRRLKSLVHQLKPDVIVNFFEPLTGIYALTTRDRPAVVAVGHQFMFEHPRFIRAPGLCLQQWGLKWYVRLVGAASTRVALSLYEAPDLPHKSLFVCPPLLRRQLFELQPANGDYVLIYLLNHGYAEQIIAWHGRNPGLRLHCFYDKPGAPAEERVHDHLTFHRLNGEKFLRMMAGCKAVVSTAGFESVCEAAYLGKPLFLVPVGNHVEQQINALDAADCGFGITDKTFNLDRLSELPPRLDTRRFRDWLGHAQPILIRSLKHAASSER
jgi:uncharacterized protein (TIGR00661 family)